MPPKPWSRVVRTSLRARASSVGVTLAWSMSLAANHLGKATVQPMRSPTMSTTRATSRTDPSCRPPSSVVDAGAGSGMGYFYVTSSRRYSAVPADARREGVEPPTARSVDSSGSSTACWQVLSWQLTSGGPSSQYAPVGPSSARWNDQRHDRPSDHRPVPSPSSRGGSFLGLQQPLEARPDGPLLAGAHTDRQRAYQLEQAARGHVP